MSRLVATLVFVHRGDEVLLGFKKRGFGAGRWNGFGGKLKPGESVLQAAIRELQEESGLEALVLEKRAIHTFSFADATPTLEVHVFRAELFRGTPVETEEMRPQWFQQGEIPYEKMWADDELWLPRYLKGEVMIGSFYFLDHHTVARHAIRAVAPELLDQAYARESLS